MLLQALLNMKDKATGMVLLKGTLSDGLYCFDGAQATSVDVSKLACRGSKLSGVNNNANTSAFLLSNCVNVVVSKNVWHRRLGHPSLKVLEPIVKGCNLPTKVNEEVKFCEACQFGKSHALPFSDSLSHASAKFDIVHTDIWGLAPVNFVHGFQFYILFLDDFSRFTWIYPLKAKSDAIIAFNHFTALVKNQFNSTIKILQSDGGGEYIPIHPVCEQSGIQLRVSCPHTSQQNGRAERKHRHVVETGTKRQIAY